MKSFTEHTTDDRANDSSSEIDQAGGRSTLSVSRALNALPGDGPAFIVEVYSQMLTMS